MQKLEDLKKQFKNQSLLDQALTHKSWVNENPDKRGSNERLEFLGDAVLELVVTDHLYKRLPTKPEGYLTALRANIVNTKNLAALGLSMNLGASIFLSKGEAEFGGAKNTSLLADSVEAIIGSIYLDSGLSAAKKFITDNLLFDLDAKLKEPLKDPKSTLQEYCQSEKKLAPKYKLVKEEGPINAREFTIEVEVGEKVLGVGVGKNKQEAQQKAAAVALRLLKTEF